MLGGLPRSCSCAVDAFGQAPLVQIKRERIGGRLREIGKAVMLLEDERGRGEGAKGHGGIAPLESPKSVAADKKTLCHIRGGDAALAPREREIAAQFAECVGRGQWYGEGFRHERNVCFNRHYIKIRLSYQTIPLCLKG
jgi:hypothetical protein